MPNLNFAEALIFKVEEELLCQAQSFKCELCAVDLRFLHQLTSYIYFLKENYYV